MSALFNRIKTWSGVEIIQNKDLNAEFDNILNNLALNLFSGWSANVTQMKIQTSPGGFGSESLSTNSSGEIERLRYQLAQIIGGTNGLWYEAPILSISQINTIISGGVSPNRLISGRIKTSSKMPIHLVPAGTSPTVTLKAAITNFVAFINGTQYTQTTDTFITSLQTAPTVNNTFVINDPNLGGGSSTKNVGDYISEFQTLGNNIGILRDYSIIGTTTGSAITALIGKYAAFKVGSEYFIGFVKSAVTGAACEITKCFRGYFFNSSDNLINSIGINNSDTVTLMQLTWVYLRNDGVLQIAYSNPTYSGLQPASPTIGDYWYDLMNQQWKTWNGISWMVTNSILVGVCIQDSTNTVAARSFDMFRVYDDKNTLELDFFSVTEMRTKFYNNYVNIYGSVFLIDHDMGKWIEPTHYDASASASLDATYFLYMTEQAIPKISQIAPHRRFDLGGYYHPGESWRCFGIVSSTVGGSAGDFDANRTLSLGRLHGDFLSDKSIGVSKLKQMGSAIPSVGLDGIAQGTTSGAFTTTSTTFVNNGGSATIVTSGRPVLILANPDGTASGDSSPFSSYTSTQGGVSIQITRDATPIAQWTSNHVVNSNGANALRLSGGSSLCFIDYPQPGSHIYQMLIKATDAGAVQVSFGYVSLTVMEL